LPLFCFVILSYIISLCLNSQSMNVFSIEKIKDLPWGWLIGVFVVYGASGYFIGGISAPWQTGAVTGAAAGAVTAVLAGIGGTRDWTGTWVWAWVLAGAAAGAAAGAVTGAAAVAAAAAAAVVVAVVVAWAGTVAGALVGIVLLDFIFDRWKNTAWFENIKLSSFFVLPALSASTMLGIVSQNILLGIGTGVGSNIIFFAQFFTTDSLYKKNFTPLNSFWILVFTNLGSLGSGWLLAFLLHSK
jgi:serine/threonine-protein kinase